MGQWIVCSDELVNCLQWVTELFAVMGHCNVCSDGSLNCLQWWVIELFTVMGHWIVCSDGSLNCLQLWVTDTQLRIHTSISFYFGSVVFGASDTKWYHVNLSSQLRQRPGIRAVRDLISINCIRMKEKTGRAPVDNLWMQVIDDWLIYAVPLKQYIIYNVSCRCRFSLWSIIYAFMRLLHAMSAPGSPRVRSNLPKFSKL